jgi:hypothetical protein
MLTGSIGALEATVEHNWEVEDLAELERAWAKLGAIEVSNCWDERCASQSQTGEGGARFQERPFWPRDVVFVTGLFLPRSS